MNFESVFLYSLLFLLIIPLFFWSRVKYVNKRRDSVKSKCPNCEHIQRLDSIINYTCVKCGLVIRYLDDDGKRRTDNTYQCESCGGENLEGIITCTSCGRNKLY